MALHSEVDAIPGIMPCRNHFVIDDDLYAAGLQAAHHCSDIGSASLERSEKTAIVGAGLQDHKISRFGDGCVKPAQHAGRGIERHASVGDPCIDSFGSKEPL